MIKNGCGRRIESEVWSYFKYDAVTNRSSCVVESDGTACGKTFTGKNPTNLKAHLQSQHAEVYTLCQKRDTALKNEKRRRTSTCSTSIQTAPQPSILNALKKPTKWTADSAEAMARETALVEYVVNGGHSSRVVEEPSFRKYSWTLDPKFDVPGSFAFSFLLFCALSTKFFIANLLLYFLHYFLPHLSLQCLQLSSLTKYTNYVTTFSLIPLMYLLISHLFTHLPS